MTPGFRHVPYNDLQAVRDAISPATIAVLIEGIQGEGGITAATPDYLLGLRALCDEQRMLLMMDAVQCGHFRTGRYQSFQRILEQSAPGVPPGPRKSNDRENAARESEHTLSEVRSTFLPDAVSMAKSMGGGLPIGAFWVRERHADLLGPGTHGTTFGGTPLACAVANRIFGIIERDGLAGNARQTGEFVKAGLQQIAQEFPQIIAAVRGVGFMMGFELAPKETIPSLAASERSASIQVVNRLHDAGVLTIPSGTQKLRLLPPLNLSRAQAEEGLSVIRNVIKTMA
jgi:acetylornithine aminotransferase/acetylornithine/N-succinyldiaminopimelate aminotransferase